MNRKQINSFIDYVLVGLELQILLTLASFPIINYAGLGFSLLSPLGNMLFTPICMTFMGLSLLIIPLLYFNLPCRIFITALELLSTLWISCLSWAPEWSMIYAPKAHPLLLVIIIAGVFLIFFNNKLKYHRKTRILLYYLLFFSASVQVIFVHQKKSQPSFVEKEK
jgi:hypothetical protein